MVLLVDEFFSTVLKVALVFHADVLSNFPLSAFPVISISSYTETSSEMQFLLHSVEFTDA